MFVVAAVFAGFRGVHEFLLSGCSTPSNIRQLRYIATATRRVSSTPKNRRATAQAGTSNMSNSAATHRTATTPANSTPARHVHVRRSRPPARLPAPTRTHTRTCAHMRTTHTCARRTHATARARTRPVGEGAPCVSESRPLRLEYSPRMRFENLFGRNVTGVVWGLAGCPLFPLYARADCRVAQRLRQRLC